MMAEAVAMGACIVDFMSYCPRFPNPGETIIGTKFAKGFGGKGANQCIMAERLGVKTAFLTKVGDDSMGEEFLEYFKKTSIISDFIMTSPSHQTSTATINITDSGENTIVNIHDAIYQLSEDDIRGAECAIKGAKVFFSTYECPIDTLKFALTMAGKHGVRTVVNAAPALKEACEAIYPLCSILCMNESEAEQATNMSVKSLEEAENACKHLVGKGAKTCIITLGDRGAVYYSSESDTPQRVNARKVLAVDTTGAGDAFMGSLVYYLVRRPEMNLQDQISKACEIATISVLKSGTTTSYPYASQVPTHLL